jgi:hypothetical protein
MLSFDGPIIGEKYDNAMNKGGNDYELSGDFL